MTSTDALLRFRCGRHAVVFTMVQGKLSCAVVERDVATREPSWCEVERADLVSMIAGLRGLLARLDEGD